MHILAQSYLGKFFRIRDTFLARSSLSIARSILRSNRRHKVVQKRVAFPFGINHTNFPVLLPACAVAWSLAGGKTLFATRNASRNVYRSPDGFFALELPHGWEHCEQEGSNEVAFVNGKACVSVATVETHPGDTVEQLLESQKSIVSGMCPAADVWAEGKATVAGAPGAYFSIFCAGSPARTVVRVSAAIIDGRFYIFKSAAPCAQLYTVQSVIDRMAKSLTAGTELLECKPSTMPMRQPNVSLSVSVSPRSA